MRFAAFAVIVLISAALVVTLFSEARAASIDIGPIPGSSTAQATHTITVDLVIPAGQRMPLSSVSAIVENNPDADPAKSSTKSYPLRARGDCNTPINGCQPPTASGPVGNAITRIQFVNFLQSGTGNPVGDGYFANGPLSFDHEGGYGYHPVAGYGYGGLSIPDPAIPNGFGYGYGDGGLIIRFIVTINPGTLGAGNYWFTFLADSGAAMSGVLSSPATSFAVSVGGGGGGGPGPGPGPGPGAVTVNTIQVTAPTGASSSFQGTVQNAAQGTQVTINAGDEVPQIELTLANDVTNAQIDITVWPADNPPPDTPALPPGTGNGNFVQITISEGGTTHTVTAFVALPEGSMDPSKAVVLKADGDGWNVIGKLGLTLANGQLTGSFDSACCSVWAVVEDQQGPEVTLDVPAELNEGLRTLSATATDNLEVDRVEFYVGEERVGTATTSPYTANWQAVAGTYTVRAVAYDVVGNSAEDSQSVTVSQQQETTTTGEDPEPKTGLGFGTLVLILLVIVVIGLIAFAVMNKKRGGQ